MASNLVLLISDQGPESAALQALRHTGVESVALAVSEVRRATEYLSSSGDFAGSPLPKPCLILVETLEPSATALELLRSIRSVRTEPLAPILVVCTAATDVQIASCYASGCNSVLTSGGDPVDRSDLLRESLRYWITLNCATLSIL